MVTAAPWVGFTRQVTGQGYMHFCYVIRKGGNRPQRVGEPPHGFHRTHGAAQRCADREARRLNRGDR